MARKLFFGSVWLALTIYAIASANFLTSNIESDFELIAKMSTGQISGINPMLVAVFYIMGLFPLTYAAFILFENKEEQVSPYPFFLGSMGLGAFALLPYLALRKPDGTWNRQKSLFQKALDSRLMAISTSIALIGLLSWGITQGDWSDYLAQWQTTQFVHIMTIDFCFLSLLFPAVLNDDFQRRGVAGWLKAIAYIPLFGALVYWCLRPQLAVKNESNELFATDELVN
ncbi:MAG: DUF2834 domain-containing protein [Cyanobacteria bacterium J06600_6]